MNTLRRDIHEYLNLRRNLGFKLQKDGKALLDFAGLVYGTALCLLHHLGVGACLGATTCECTTGALGAAIKLRAWICPLSQCK